MSSSIQVQKIIPIRKKFSRKGKANPNAKLGKDFSVNDVVECARKKGGFITDVAKALNVHYNTVTRWKKKYKAIKEAFFEANERQLDFTESQLMKSIKKGNVTAIIFYLKTKGKHRGYTERFEHKITEGEQGQVVIYLPDNGRDKGIYLPKKQETSDTSDG